MFVLGVHSVIVFVEEVGGFCGRLNGDKPYGERCAFLLWKISLIGVLVVFRVF